MNKVFPAVGSMASVADDLENFLIAKAPVLAAEFASGQMGRAVQPVPPTRKWSGTEQYSPPAWMLEIAGGEILATNDAAAIVGVTSTQAIRTRCEDREREGRPIGVCFGGFRGTWLVSLRLLLEDIEREEGRSARLAAESRAKKLPKFGSKQILGSETDRNLL